MKPWECPRCGQVNAPHVSACTCKPSTGFADRFVVGKPEPVRRTTKPRFPEPPRHEIPTPVTHSTRGALDTMGRVSPPGPATLADVLAVRNARPFGGGIT